MPKVVPDQCSLLLPSMHPSTFCAEQQSLTVWMKSLIMNGNGCTVYDSNGQVVYRVDNYGNKSSNEVYLMDRDGKILIQIRRKRFSLFGQWEGYSLISEESKPCFQVQKKFRIMNRDKPYEHRVIVGYRSVNPSYYRIILSCSGKKTEYQITTMAGEIVAEVKGKQTASGISLGSDVLMLVIEPNVDQLFIVGLVVVCGLINHAL